MIHSVYYQCDYWWLYCIYTHLWPRKKVHSWNRNLQSLRPWPCRKSTEVQRVGEFDPLRREVEVNKPFNMCVCVQRGGFDPLWREVEVNKKNQSTCLFRGGGALIPYEEKWKLRNHSTYLFRGGALIPYEEKWKLTKKQSKCLFRGGGDLIPYEEKWKLINHSTYLFRGGALIPYEEKWKLTKKTNQHVCSEGVGLWSLMKRSGS